MADQSYEFRMIAFRDLIGAKTAFLKALKFSCASDECIIVKNFNKLLRDHGQNTDAYDEFRIDTK